MKFNIQETAKEKRIIVAHRGTAGGNIPCNTLASYEIALKQGADMIEIDVEMSKDGKLFIFHPGMEPHHLNSKEYIPNMTAEEVSKLRYVNYDRTPTQFGVNTFDATMVAGNSAAANADNIVFDIMTAFYTACASFMGQNYGAGKKKRLLRSYFISLAYAFGTALIVGWLLVAFGHQFLSLFTKDPAVVEAGMKRLTIMGSAYCLSAFMDCSIAASRALGKSLAPTVIVIMGSCVFRVIWIYTIFAHFQTIPSLYMLYVFSWTITSIAEIIYFAKIYKKQTAKLVPNILS